MMESSTTSSLNVEYQAGKPPRLQLDFAGLDRGALRAFVAEHGALLLAGIGVHDLKRAEMLFRLLGEPMTEVEAFTPRQRHAPGVYSATTWPPNQPMCMHHELSYTLEVPSLMLFACLVAPSGGGATPIADAALVLEALPAGLVERFERLGWLLIRNYNPDIGASIADAFGTDDPSAVERYCRANSIGFEWRDGGRLRTWQRRSAVVRHPLTGRRCWFNQIAFLNEWTLEPELREYLVDIYGADGLPFNTRFGNGDSIDPDIIQTINTVYEAHTVRERWRDGDVLVVDNIRTAHAREAFEGPREIVVGLADAVRLEEHR